MVTQKMHKDIFLTILRDDSDKEIINKRLKDLGQDDWQALYMLAVKNGLFSIFYSKLLTLNSADIPPETLSAFKNLYILNLKRNTILQRELFKIIAQLKEDNIPAIPLKGPLWTRILYNDLALRQAPCDLDLLVEARNIERAQKNLEGIGYHFYSNSAAANYLLKFKRQIILQNQDGLMIDLHWDFLDRFVNMHGEDMWPDAREVVIDGHTLLTPSYEDILLYLALSAISRFDFIQIKYICDINMLLTLYRRKIDWQTLTGRAKRFNLDTALFFALKLSRGFFNTSPPEEFVDIKPPPIKNSLLRLWVNKDNVLKYRERTASAYLWRYVATSFIYSKSVLDCAAQISKKIFLPMDEVMGMSGQPISRRSPPIYIKRLLNPLSHFEKRRS